MPKEIEDEASAVSICDWLKYDQAGGPVINSREVSKKRMIITVINNVSLPTRTYRSRTAEPTLKERRVAANAS